MGIIKPFRLKTVFRSGVYPGNTANPTQLPVRRVTSTDLLVGSPHEHVAGWSLPGPPFEFASAAGNPSLGEKFLLHESVQQRAQ